MSGESKVFEGARKNVTSRKTKSAVSITKTIKSEKVLIKHQQGKHDQK